MALNLVTGGKREVETSMAGTFLSAGIFGVTDEQAMWRVKMDDDAQAFAQLVRRWEKPIQSLCARMTGDTHRGQDLTQEAFARVFAGRKDYQASGKFATFLWRVALNLCYDELRKVGRRRESLLEDGGEESESETLVAANPAPDFALVEQERAEAVRCALLKLSEPYRTVVVMRHYEGLKFREISEVLEIPEGTVKSRMAEALAQLNDILTGLLNERESVCKTKTSPQVPAI
ncbi:MAG TPA: RNA polymerase sigma factor [Verrucomicrobiae bacterium]|jgi:RNA polymerase sigma-70 factor (ECF subfamily)|nr:RNA polymerase sigma factor [Verrucomicrobiae bacterium]